MRRLITFKGTLTAEQPISYSVPGVSKNGEHALPRLGGRVYLTASGIRGALRHAAAGLVMDLLDAQSRPKLTLDDYFLLSLGGIKNAKTKGKGTGEAQEGEADAEDGEKPAKDTDADVVRILRATKHARSHNPLVGLFGSMRHGVSGALYCTHALAPEDASTSPVRHVRANDFQRDPTLLERLDASALDALVARQAVAATRSEGNQRIKALQREQKSARKNGTQDRMQELSAEIQEVRGSLPSEVQVQLPHIMYEAIAAGTVFTHEFVLSNPSDAEVALFLRVLDRFATNPFIGGHRAHGCGLVSGHWSVRMRADGERDFVEAGEVSFKGDFTGLDLTGRIAEFFESWDALVAQKGALDFTESGIAAA
ncbi:MAG: hypothetical protein ACP5P4_14840 [Steroidobacteraceae bacterium]